MVQKTVRFVQRCFNYNSGCLLFVNAPVNFLNDLDKKDAEQFLALCRFGWIVGIFTPLIFDVNAKIYIDNGLNFSTLTHLDSIGLIQFSNITSFSRTGVPKSFTAAYCGQPLTLTMQNEKDNKLDIGRVILTQVGTELATVCQAQGVDGFFNYVKKKWKSFLPEKENTEPDA